MKCNGKNHGGFVDLNLLFKVYLQEKESLEKRIKSGNGSSKRRSHRLRRLQMINEVLLPNLQERLYMST